MVEIITLRELVGRTIVDATMWDDGESMSLRLDNGGILQINAIITNGEPAILYEVEFALKEPKDVG